MLWVATEDWESADNTIPPLPSSFVSAYIGKDPITLMGILKEAPRASKANQEVFADLDTQALQDGSLLLCEVYDHKDPEDPEDDESNYPQLVSFRATPFISAWTLLLLTVKPPDEGIEEVLENGRILSNYRGRYTKPD